MEEILANFPNAGVVNSLERIYRKKIFSEIVNALLITGSIVIASMILCSTMQLIFGFETIGRAILFFMALIAILTPIIKYLIPNVTKYFQSPNIKYIKETALEVGNKFPELKDRLRNAIELLSDQADPERNKYSSHELVRTYVEQIFTDASHHNISSALRHRSSAKAKYAVLSSAVAGIILFLLLPSQMLSALGEILNFTKKIPGTYSVEVSPGDVRLSRGDTLKIKTKVGLITGRQVPSYITVSERYNNERDFEEHRVNKSPNGEYYFQVPNVRSNLKYFVTVGDQNSDEYNVEVEDLPIVQSFHVTLVYPSYTKKATETLQDNIGDFSALVGTRAEFTLQTNKELESAWMLIDDSTKKTFNVNGETANGDLIVNRTMKYTLRLLDGDSLGNRDPIVYTVQVANDEYPTCEITFPGKDIDLPRTCNFRFESKLVMITASRSF